MPTNKCHVEIASKSVQAAKKAEAATSTRLEINELTEQVSDQRQVITGYQQTVRDHYILVRAMVDGLEGEKKDLLARVHRIDSRLVALKSVLSTEIRATSLIHDWATGKL